MPKTKRPAPRPFAREAATLAAAVVGLVSLPGFLRADGVTANPGDIRTLQPGTRPAEPRRSTTTPTTRTTSRPSEAPVRSGPTVGRTGDGTGRTGALRRPESGTTSATNGVASPWTTLLALVVVVAVIVVLGRLWSKHGPGLAGGLPPEAIELLGRRPLDARQTIHLVRLGHRILVLGSSPEGLRTLAEIDDPVEVDYLAGLCRTNEGGGVAESFRSLFGRSNPPTEHEPTTPTPVRASDESRDSTAPVTADTPAGEDSDSTGDEPLRRRLVERMQGAVPAGEEVLP